jgi:hypothetical protein
MILGNSRGNNRGKKYLKKDKVDDVYADSAELFNTWFSENYNSLVSSIKDRYIYDEDVFHETYKNIYEKILFLSFDGDGFLPYFLRSYYTNRILNECKESLYCELLPNADKEDIDPEYYSDMEENQKKLETDILNYIYLNYNIREFELFKMYTGLKPAVNYSTLAGITGISRHKIQRVISKIKKDIRSNKDFSKRRRDIL